ncbi:MAG: phage tail protein [Holophagaceae bacterium]|uniref:Phage tail protein n=1 Tax=Candidatus Geothrix skivensis TaxID=2954439 RepID=A0A9D7SHP0_9BACT|nr:phage tail protein [Candidatus Geothrix skivensis]
MTRRGSVAAARDGMEGRPVLGSNFLVDLGDGKAHQSSGGFAEVIFPEFRLGPGQEGHPTPAGAGGTLILRRGICGALDLYAWWDKARVGKTARGKSIKVMLLGQDQRTVVLTWTFHKVHPVALSYSPLRARENDVAMETIELAFASFEMC